jgi:hypothetical protein
LFREFGIPKIKAGVSIEELVNRQFARIVLLSASAFRELRGEKSSCQFDDNYFMAIE